MTHTSREEVSGIRPPGAGAPTGYMIIVLLMTSHPGLLGGGFIRPASVVALSGP
ncbi:MAG: hypothetical protein KDC08_02060 [Actinobacteria bacterium]|nr:hypothetical protein [Actinomycetota bacterium]